MKNRMKKAGTVKWSICGYIFVMLLGGTMLGARSVPDIDTDNPSQKVVRDLARAIEQIAEDAKDEQPFDDSPEPGEGDTDSQAESVAPSDLIVSLPAPNPQGGEHQSVLILRIHETIDMGLAAFVTRSIAEHPRVSAIIFDINTPGGRVDAATKIRDAIMGLPKKIRSVAFIHPRAISAGAFISFACDYIFIADGGSIGAATPITIDGGKANAVGEKYVSYFRAEMASTARAKGRNGKIAAAMVDADIEIKGITPKGKLLTLDTNGALRHKVANDRANSIWEVKTKIALPKAKQKKLTMNWAEKLARILTDPMLSGILMSIGMLGIFIELYHPGFGFPGIIGITCLVIFFAGHMVVQLAGLEEIALFVVGVALLLVEIFVIPGFGIVGALGIASIVAALVLSLTALPLDVSWSIGTLGTALSRVMVSFVATAVLLFVLILFIPKSTFFKNRLVLQTAIRPNISDDSQEGQAALNVPQKGSVGRAESYLRPAGIADFDGNRVDVQTEGDFIEAGTIIEAIRQEGNHLVVKKKDSTG